MEHTVSSEPKPKLTPQEYLSIERKAEIRSEYLDGEMFAMPGAQRGHNLIVVNLATELSTQLIDRPFEVYAADMRTKVSSTGLYTYPDIVVISGEPRFEDDYVDTLLNPTVIIEVLSASSESYDRGRKFAQYRAIDSLQEYLLVSQYECRIERFARQSDGNWTFSDCTSPEGSVNLESIACRLSVSRVYHKVNFE